MNIDPAEYAALKEKARQYRDLIAEMEVSLAERSADGEGMEARIETLERDLETSRSANAILRKECAWQRTLKLRFELALEDRELKNAVLEKELSVMSKRAYAAEEVIRDGATDVDPIGGDHHGV